MCDVANVNVAIFKHLGENLYYHDGVFGHPGQIACVKLFCNNAAEVRSHFERVLTETEMRKLSEQRVVDEENRRIAQ